MIRYFVFAIVFALIIRTGSASSAEFNIKISIVPGEDMKRSIGSGGFTVSDSEYGRVIVRFYGDDPRNFSVSAIGSKQLPPSIGDEENRSADLTLTADFYLAPSVTPDSKIRLRGKLFTSQHPAGAAPGLFEQRQNDLDFVLPNGGEEPYVFTVGDGVNVTCIKISVTTQDKLIYTPRTVNYVDLKAQYEMTNTQSNQIELQGGCNLGMSGDGDEGKGSCYYHKVYRLPNGDSLLYLATFELSDVKVGADGRVSCTVGFVHLYAVNPDLSAGYNEIKSDQTTSKTFERNITVDPNEPTTVEIPQDKDSQLPFPSSEKLTLTFKVTTKTI